METHQVTDATIATKPETDFVKILDANGYRKGCGDWRQYERGKRLIDNLSASSEDYDRMLTILADFLEL